MITDGSHPSHMDPDPAQTPSSTALQSTTQQPCRVAPPFVAPAPDAPHDPAVETMEQPADMRPPVIVAPPSDDRVELVQQPLKGLRVAPIGNLADPRLETLDRAVSGVGVEVWTSGLVLHSPSPLDLVAQELKALDDMDDARLVRVNPKPEFSLQHCPSARQRPLCLPPGRADTQPVIGVPGEGVASLCHLLVEDVQIDVAEQRADHPTLGHPGG